jgi:hypothetical protein
MYSVTGSQDLHLVPLYLHRLFDPDGHLVSESPPNHGSVSNFVKNRHLQRGEERGRVEEEVVEGHLKSSPSYLMEYDLVSLFRKRCRKRLF